MRAQRHGDPSQRAGSSPRPTRRRWTPQKEFVKRGLDPEDELIEVGVAIVGGGTAGLACANRLLQLLGRRSGDDGAPRRSAGRGDREGQDLRRAQPLRRGDAPRAAAGALPGADARAVAPGGLRLRRGQEGGGLRAAQQQDQAPHPDRRRRFKNHGNEVISVSALARYQQRQAEEAGAYILTETAATQLIVEDGRVVGVRSGDKGRGKDGEELGNFEPGTDIKAQATVLAEGCWGHLTGAAIREFDLAEGREPQVWELGVKEVWKVAKPLDRVIHTLAGWPLKISAKYGQIGGSWIYPMKNEKTGEDLVSIGFVVDLDYADATTSAHDLLQQIKTHPLVQGDPRGRRARRLGRQGAAGRRLLGDAEALDARRGARRRRRRDGRTWRR